MAMPTIRMGSTDRMAIETAQAYLISFGYLPASTAKGVFGPIMDGAVKAFQKAYGLQPVDGIIGPNTWLALTTVRPPNGQTYIPSAVSIAPSTKPGPSVTPAEGYSFEPMEIVGRMPGPLDKLKAGWSKLSRGQKVGVAGVVILLGGWMLSKGK